jgi:hypothetical protein
MSQPGWPIQRIITPLRRQEDPFPVREHHFWHSDTLYWHFVPDRPTEPPPKKPDPPHRRPATDPLDFEQRNAFLEAAQHNRHINSDSPVGKQPHHPPTHHEGKKTKNRHSRHSQPKRSKLELAATSKGQSKKRLTDKMLDYLLAQTKAEIALDNLTLPEVAFTTFMERVSHSTYEFQDGRLSNADVTQIMSFFGDVILAHLHCPLELKQNIQRSLTNLLFAYVDQ